MTSLALMLLLAQSPFDAGFSATLQPAAPLPEAALAEQAALRFFDALQQGNGRALAQMSQYPFMLEGQRIDSLEAATSEWMRRLRSARTDLLRLEGMEIYTPADMEKKHGRPPARLAQLPWQRARTYLAVANLSGHPIVVVVRSDGPGKPYLAVGYTD